MRLTQRGLRYLADPYWLYNKVLIFLFHSPAFIIKSANVVFWDDVWEESHLLFHLQSWQSWFIKNTSDYKSDIIMWWSLAGVSFALRICQNDLPLINISSNLESSGVSAETEGVMKRLPHSLLPCFFFIPACYRLLFLAVLTNISRCFAFLSQCRWNCICSQCLSQWIVSAWPCRVCCASCVQWCLDSPECTQSVPGYLSLPTVSTLLSKCAVFFRHWCTS